MRVADIMNPHPAVATPDTPVDLIIRRMADEHLGAIIVVDSDHHPVGVISMTDVIIRNARLHFPRYIQLFDSILFLQDTRKYEDEVRRFLAVTARELMTPNP
ncbi:MAG: CBS domain-containing protein, partial [Dehalococcoidia bacterium]|nr:CBS domain-containing protein [Dehalococcoidia bacterium]